MDRRCYEEAMLAVPSSGSVCLVSGAPGGMVRLPPDTVVSDLVYHYPTQPISESFPYQDNFTKYAKYARTMETQPKEHCEYCNGTTFDDGRGNCCACGAPRKRIEGRALVDEQDIARITRELQALLEHPRREDMPEIRRLQAELNSKTKNWYDGLQPWRV